MAGHLITLEGGEGAGKSTLLQGLVTALSARGIAIVATREPGGTPLAESVRTLVLDPPGGHDWTPLAQALLMNAARADHIDALIRPAVKAGKVVISDRYSDSTRVYQMVGGGVAPAHLKAMEDIVTAEARPALTLILDAAPEALLNRRQQRTDAEHGNRDGKAPDVFEARDLDFHRAIRDGFLDIARAEPGRCLVLDALAEPPRILERALSAITLRLGL